jgi:hypothetical protein
MDHTVRKRSTWKLLLAVILFVDQAGYAHEAKESYPTNIPAIQRLTFDEMIDLLPGMKENSGGNFSASTALEEGAEKNLNDQAAEERETPPYIAGLKQRKISEYFPAGIAEGQDLDGEALTRLLYDCIQVHRYFESKNTGQMREFVSRTLAPFIRSLKAKQLLKGSGTSDEIRLADWDIEMLVAAQELAHQARMSKPLARISDFVMGRHMRGVSIATRAAIAGGSVYLMSRLVHADGYLVAFLLGTLTGGMYGITGEIGKSLTSWGLTPTTEYIKVVNARNTADWEIFINKLYDSIKPEADMESERRNERARIANLHEDGMNFCYMDPADQDHNFECKDKPMFVAITKTYGQLLRDAHHYGRTLLEMPWKDEQAGALLIEQMDAKLHAFNTQSELFLTRTSQVNGMDKEAAERLASTFDYLQYLCSRTYLAPLLNGTERQALRLRIASTLTELTRQGVSMRDLEKLMAIQGERAKATGTLITAVTVNEIISLNHPENNRNLDSEARQAQRVVRRRLNLQSYVDRYFRGVRQVQNEMGYRNWGKGAPQDDSCERMMARVSGNHPQDVK